MKKNILKLQLFLLMVVATKITGQIQDDIIDDPGDIAFVAYHDSPDGFAFVFLDNCPIGSSIRFVDDEWTGTNFSSPTGEGEVLWINNTGAIISAGTVITIENADDNGTGIMASLGTATEDESGFNVANGDQIYAITGTRATPNSFLAFVGEDDSLGDSATLMGTGLISGQHALLISLEGYYFGSTTCNGTVENCAAMINNSANWTLGDFSFPAASPSMFTGSGISGNNIPVATAPSAPIVLEDAMNVALENDIQVTDIDGNDQTVTFSVTGGIVTLGVTGITFGGSGNGSASFTATGSLDSVNAALDAASFTPTANLNGPNAGIISFTTNDGTDTSSAASISFDITSVNDEPSFVIGANQAKAVNAGNQTVNGFVTMIDDSDAEVVQTVSFDVTNDNNGLFNIQPGIDTAGNLTYTPSTGMTGTATVNVIAIDDGGTANGGENTSVIKTFDIEIIGIPVITSITTDSGSSATDYITNDNRPSINGTAYPGSTISAILGGNDSFDSGISTTADAVSGTFTLDYPVSIGGFPVSELAEGSTSFQVVARTNGLTLNSDEVLGTVDTTDPSITSAVTAEFAENGTGTAYTITATDATTLTYSISGGMDASDFNIVAATGAISFITTPDFEMEDDNDMNNIYVINVVATDLAGNSSMETISITVTDEDEIAPTVIISSTENSSTATSPIPITITFSESVSGLDIGEIIVSNGSVDNFSGSGTTYTIDIIPTAFGEVTVDLAADVANDAAGNRNTVAKQFIIIYDTTLSNNNQVLAQMLRILPNPASDYIRISHNSNQKLESLEVYDLLGKLVLTQNLNSISENTISLSTVPSGIYWFRVNSSNTFAIKRVVIE